MSIDIQKQVNFRAQNNNIINAPQLFSNEQVQQPVDEEKSNAAKLMIGLTATAAVVIGGIWAAKKGHLGESAQKYANKLFGTTDSVKPKPEAGTSTTSSTTGTGSSTSTGATTSTSTVASTATRVAAVIPPLVVARKAISKLIKAPKNMDDTIKYLDDLGVRYKLDMDDLTITIKSGKSSNDNTLLAFDDDKILGGIFRRGKENSREIFEFVENKLTGILREYPDLSKTVGSKKYKNLTQEIRFDDNKKVVEEIWEVGENGLDHLTLTSVKDLNNSFNANKISDWEEYLWGIGSKRPKRFNKIKIYPLEKAVNGDYETARYLTARVAKYWGAPLSRVPKEIPAEEFARYIHKTTHNHFSDIAESFNVERNIAHRVSDAKMPELYPKRIIEHYDNDGEFKEVSKVKEEFINYFLNDKSGRKAEVFSKLLKDDLGDAKKFNENTIISAAEAYERKFKAYGLDSDIDLMEISVKALKDCTYEDVMKIIKHRAPERAGQLPVVADDFKTIDQEQKAISRLIEIVTGRKNTDSNTKLFDLLQDIS